MMPARWSRAVTIAALGEHQHLRREAQPDQLPAGDPPEGDRRRYRELTALGWRPIRITWRQLLYERRELAADVGRMLLGPSTLAA